MRYTTADLRAMPYDDLRHLSPEQMTRLWDGAEVSDERLLKPRSGASFTRDVLGPVMLGVLIAWMLF